MHEKHIICTKCGKKYPMTKRIFICQKCRGSLEIIFDYTKIKKTIFSVERASGKKAKKTQIHETRFSQRPFNHSRYIELFPVKRLISLGEGGTPLIRSRNIEKKFRLGFELYFKYEAQNPTGSFKDRGSSVELSKAHEFRARKVICASTGNMGASVSAYSAIAGMDCFIFTPQDARPVKLEQILAYGSKLFQVDGDYTQTERLVEEAYRKHRLYLLGDYLYRREGTKSVGFEIAEQLPDVDYVFSPVGNGTLISASWKAFSEFNKLGLLEKTPKIAGIQAEGCNPVERAFKSKANIKAIANPRTIAMAIECGSPLDGEMALNAIRESKGHAESVSDDEILVARELLAMQEGLFAEPAGAVSLAGVLKYRKWINKKSKVACIITGHGLKTPFTGISGKLYRIGPQATVLKTVFAKHK